LPHCNKDFFNSIGGLRTFAAGSNNVYFRRLRNSV